MEQLTGLKRSNIRFYEKEKLITPTRNESNGYREYTKEDAENIKKIAYFVMALVITGCVVNPNSLDGAFGEVGGYAMDNAGKKVAIPTAYYKAVLRYKKDDKDVGYAGYCGCAVYLEHDSSLGSGSVSKSDLISIDDLESILGFDLFVNLPAAIGESNAAKVESQNPQSIGLW